MTMGEAEEAARLVETLRLLRKELKDMAKCGSATLAFEDEYYFERGCFQAMVLAGLDYARTRLGVLGVGPLTADGVKEGA